MVDTPAIEMFGEQENELSPEVLDETRKLCIQVYSKKYDDFDNIATLRAHNFLKHKPSSLLKLLPTTEGAFKQHVKCSALATIIDKRSHLAKPWYSSSTNNSVLT